MPTWIGTARAARTLQPAGHNQAAPRTPLESPCMFRTTRVFNWLEKTWRIRPRSTICARSGRFDIPPPRTITSGSRMFTTIDNARDSRSPYKASDSAAIGSLALYGDRLSRALSMVVNILDPEVIVLGGGMSNLPDLAQIVERGLMRHVFSSQLKTRVVRNMHGDSSGVRGAAWLWPAG